MGQCLSNESKNNAAATTTVPALLLPSKQQSPSSPVVALPTINKNIPSPIVEESKSVIAPAPKQQKKAAAAAVFDYDDPSTQSGQVLAECPANVRVELPSALKIGPTKYGGHGLYATRAFKPGDVVYNSSYRIVNDVKPDHPIMFRVYQSNTDANTKKSSKKDKKGVCAHAAHKKYQRKPTAQAQVMIIADEAVSASGSGRLPSELNGRRPSSSPSESEVKVTAVPPNVPERNSHSASSYLSPSQLKQQIAATPEVDAEAVAVATVAAATAPATVHNNTEEDTTSAAGAGEEEEHEKPVLEFELDLHTHAVRHKTGQRRMYSFDSMTNHSCQGHTFEYATAEQRSKGQFSVIACRPIAPGDEIHTDYALYEADCRDKGITECQCGSSDCHGFMAGFLYLSVADQLTLIRSGRCVPEMFGLVLGAAQKARALGLTLTPSEAKAKADEAATRDGQSAQTINFPPTVKGQSIAPVAVDERVIAAIHEFLATVPERNITAN